MVVVHIQLKHVILPSRVTHVHVHSMAWPVGSRMRVVRQGKLFLLGNGAHGAVGVGSFTEPEQLS